VKIQIIISTIIFIYLALSTLLYGTGLVGNIGNIIGGMNIELFGNLAYVNMFLLLYPIYKIQEKPSKITDIDFYIGWLLFFISLIILSSLIFEPSESGILAKGIYSFLVPYIGKAGIWLLLFMLFLLYLVLTIDDDFDIDDLYNQLNDIKDFFYYLGDKINSLKIPEKSFDINFSKIIRNPFESSYSDIMMTYNANSKKFIDPRENKKMPNNSFEAQDIIKVPKNEKSKIVIINELEENSKLLEMIEKGEDNKPKNFELPKISFLKKETKTSQIINRVELNRKIEILLDYLDKFKIDEDVIKTYYGSFLTTFEFKLAPNVKLSKILNLQDELAVALNVKNIKIETSISSKDIIRIEIPNDNFYTIHLGDILESKLFKEAKSPLTIALGEDIVGNPFITDLKKLPNLLILGEKGSGKSVGINSMILSLLYKNDPYSLKLVLIDTEKVQFSIYNDIPHLFRPLISETKEAISVLNNLVLEMEKRYKLIEENKVKDINKFNEKMEKEYGEKMPFIVIFIDELSDLITSEWREEIDYSISVLAKRAKDTGIHLVVATRKPTDEVITDLIKKNFSSRLSYKVNKEINSKVILDEIGAERLLGRGDALFSPSKSIGLIRVHTPWNDRIDIEKIVEFLKS